MEDNKSNIFSGVVKMFNGKFGFIQYQDGDIFFHKSAISTSSKIDDRCRVSFTIEPSPKKNGKLQAVNLTLLLENETLKSNKTGIIELLNSKIEKTENNKPIISNFKFNIGTVKWHDYRGYGVIETNKNEYFFRNEDVCGGHIDEGYKCIFFINELRYKEVAFNIFIIAKEFFEDFQNVISDEELFRALIFEKLCKIENIVKNSDFTIACQLLDILVEFKMEISHIVDDLYEKSSIEYRFRFWFNRYTQKSELNNISKFLFISYNQPLNTSFREIITTGQKKSVIERLMSNSNHKVVIDQFIKDIKSITSYIGRYDIFNMISDLVSISKEEKGYFFNEVYQICDNQCKFEMWEAEYVIENDMNIILEHIPSYLSGFVKIFQRLNEEEKYVFLKKSIDEFHKSSIRYSCHENSINKLFELQDVTIFLNSDYFNNEISRADKANNFWFIWYIKTGSIDSDFVASELSCEDFIDFMKVAKQLDKDYSFKMETFYSELPVYLKLQLWLNNLFGSFDYIEFAKSFHVLTVNDRKLFNKKVKEHAQDEQIKSFVDQIPTAELIEDNSGQKRYKCKWRNIYFNYQQIQVFLNKKESTTDFHCSFSRPELNLLTQEYFTNRRIDDIYVTVNNDYSINRIDGLESIETQIIFAEIRKNGSPETRKNVSNEEIIRMIHNVGERNKCIKFLNKQNSPFNVVDIQELVTEVYGGLRRDISFLYCLPDNNDSIYLVWESVEFEKSKATHIFKCKTLEVENYIDEIKRFLESTIHSRSKLNSSEIEDVDQKKKLNYFGRVIHDSKEYEVWEERMKSTLPFLR